MTKKRDIWTDPDPQPEDLDEYLANGGELVGEWLPPNPDLKVTIVEDDDPRLLRLLGRPAAQPGTPAPRRSP